VLSLFATNHNCRPNCLSLFTIPVFIEGESAMLSQPTVTMPDQQPLFLWSEDHRLFLAGYPSKLHIPRRWWERTLQRLAYWSLILFIFLLASTWRWWQFTAYGVITEAKVIDKNIDRDDDGTTYYLIYEYNARMADQTQQRFTGRDSVSAATYEMYEMGEFLNVRYVKHDPAYVTSKWHRNWIWELGAAYGAVLPILCLGFVIIPRRWRQRTKQFNDQGQALTGRVVTVLDSTDSEENYCVRVCYEFTLPSGQEHYAEVSAVRDDLKNKPLPGYGAPIMVLYLDEHNFFLL
jgi:hypothetical protein